MQRLAILIGLTATLIIVFTDAEPPSGQDSGNSQSGSQYGPPEQQQQQQPQYGPPGFTPGQPIGYSSDQSQNCPPNDPEYNRQLVMGAYKEVFGHFQDKDYSKLDQFFAQDYIQHNPNLPDGLDSLKRGLMGPLGEGPISIKRMAAEGDLVWTHFAMPLGKDLLAVVDIVRIQCGKIQEHWDVQQSTTLKMPSANSHPFF